MSRLSNRDVDAIVQMEYEDALGDGKEWALESHDYHRWVALDGKRVRVIMLEGDTYEGLWDWHGPTGDDFYLVYINDDQGKLIIGTDPRNMAEITVLPKVVEMVRYQDDDEGRVTDDREGNA